MAAPIFGLLLNQVPVLVKEQLRLRKLSLFDLLTAYLPSLIQKTFFIRPGEWFQVTSGETWSCSDSRGTTHWVELYAKKGTGHPSPVWGRSVRYVVRTPSDLPTYLANFIYRWHAQDTIRRLPFLSIDVANYILRAY